MLRAISFQRVSNVLNFFLKRLLTTQSKLLTNKKSIEKDPPNGNETNEEEDSINQKSKELETSATEPKEKQFPEEPTTCCMSGCANCVWLEYAEKISEYFQDGGEAAIQEIEEKVQDPNIKAFLLTELRMRQKNQK